MVTTAFHQPPPPPEYKGEGEMRETPGFETALERQNKSERPRGINPPRPLKESIKVLASSLLAPHASESERVGEVARRKAPGPVHKREPDNRQGPADNKSEPQHQSPRAGDRQKREHRGSGSRL